MMIDTSFCESCAVAPSGSARTASSMVGGTNTGALRTSSHTIARHGCPAPLARARRCSLGNLFVMSSTPFVGKRKIHGQPLGLVLGGERRQLRRFQRAPRGAIEQRAAAWLEHLEVGDRAVPQNRKTDDGRTALRLRLHPVC